MTFSTHVEQLFAIIQCHANLSYDSLICCKLNPNPNHNSIKENVSLSASSVIFYTHHQTRLVKSGQVV